MKRYLLPLFILLPVAWVLGAFESLGDCDHCGGAVNLIGDECWSCSPSHFWDRVGSRTRSAVPVMVALFWVSVILSVPGGLIWSVIAVDCRICGGGGILRQQATLSGDRQCHGCRGWGRLSALDSLILRSGWE